ncbi:MAG TPA: hypothetical protein VFD74_04975, partial [Thermoleophilia bacterium]|nr:hypothetical protein [Thermoleophilia bacterium]
MDPEFLSRFEAGLDLRSPAASVIPARVLGHGEITTVLDISRPTAGATTAVACKRMPMFRSDAEAAAYDTLYHEYEQILREEVGVDVVESRLVWLGWDPDAGAGRVDAAPGRPLADAPAPSARSSAADPAPSPLGRAGAVRTIVLY